jgi:8-oxo-dGTP diphosphatase
MPERSPSHASPDNPVVGILGIIRRGDRLLMIQRAQGVRAPLMWCFPGGHIEPGETQTQALVREMREELNVDVLPGEYLMTQTKHGGRLVLHCWSATIPAGEPTPTPAEIAAIVWMTPAEVRAKRGVLPGTTAILDAIGL